jgi:branched-chain amino acid transport system ATP-binding protein
VANLLSLRGVDTWYGPVRALDAIDLDLAPGRIACVLGANGAGKTTLLNTIAGVVSPRCGTIHFEGHAIQGLDADAVARRGLVLVPEGRQLFPFLTVHENLSMGGFSRPRDTAYARDMSRVYEWFPRLRERMKQQAGLMSGGEQQMVAIGRAYMSRPKLLLLDEPSLGLSPLFTKEIFGIVRRIRQETDTAVLVVEQNAAVALDAADDGFIVELGRITDASTAQALRERTDIKNFYLGTQASSSAASASACALRGKQAWY